MKLQSAIGLSTSLILLSFSAKADLIGLYCYEQTGVDKEPLFVEMSLNNSEWQGGCDTENYAYPDTLEKHVTCIGKDCIYKSCIGDDDTYLTIYEANRKTGVMVIEQFVSKAGRNETELISREVYDCENSNNMPNKF